ncbi:MAG: hypothetical protein BWX88_04742 [Planctomycetes bacterium ADurb.Bin126]|nr:MAG: hypothetical protein BWX88_04742 [Planctomycetes bacterium ADurb.Bin126]HOD83954.1 hypothetical protein [Phycisphaerae bacterium]HQL75588.1 hypothetical protein [Phycisphaerae bacterium]
MVTCRYFHIHGLELTLQGPKALADALGDYLDDFICPHVSSEGASVVLEWVKHLDIRQPSRRLDRLWEGPNPDGDSTSYWVCPNHRRLEIAGRLFFDLDLQTRSARVVLAEGGEDAFLRDALILLLCELLATCGSHALHCACLSLKKEDLSPAVLICGPSGSGKTTTALALERSGLCRLADDATFLCRPDGSPMPSAWGLASPAKICPPTLDLLPWLAGTNLLARAGQEALSLPPGRADGRSRLLVIPRVILFLDGRTDGEHHLQPLQSVQAVARLSSENVRAGHPELYDQARRRFALLARLGGCARGLALQAGPRLDTLGSHIRRLLEEAGTC